MIRSGSLQYKIDILRAGAETVDSYGARSNAWPVWRTISAEITERKVEETTEPSGTVTRETITFRARYRAGITTADRISFGGKQYEIRSVLEIGRRQALEIVAIAREAT